jgi:hypothetical protein
VPRRRRPEVAFVVQRYGEGITGGSESLARAVAERLAGEHRITVLTTCARDYVTWRNELPAGRSAWAASTSSASRSKEERDLAAFNAFAEPLYARERSREEEIEFLRRQGPHCPGLVEALRAEKDRFAAVVFFTYLYSPTYWGLQAAPERSALVPTTHDEPPLRFGVYREVFALPRAFGFLTPAEEALVRAASRWGRGPGFLVGMGVDVPRRPTWPASARASASTGPTPSTPAASTPARAATRCSPTNGGTAGSGGGEADLVLIGRLAMPLPAEEGVRYLGYLPEEEKAAAMAGARAVVCPSPYESLSITLLEASPSARPPS